MAKKSYKIKCTVSYDGTNYGGFQIQDNAMTIQQRIEEALRSIVKQPTTVYASGRTDAGVHANGQVFHFETSVLIPVERWPLALNGRLPKDIVILEAERVPDHFHARYDAIHKTYRYCVWNQRILDVFLRNYAWHIPYALDIEAMRRAASYLVGEHDFTSFCSMKTTKQNKVRRIDQISIEAEASGKIRITFGGNGFLHHMIRIIVGTLIQVAAGRLDVENVQRILQARDRQQVGTTAPPQGLFLMNVTYDRY